jgi:SNF2 family DNA or RNA helicase
MGTRVEFKDEHFLVTIRFEENWRLNALPSKKWQPSARRWVVPADWRSAEILTENIPAKYWDDEAANAVNGYLSQKLVLKPKHDPSGYPFKTKPMAHQWEAYEKAYAQDQFALFFEQGLGKTKTAIDLATMWHLDGIIDTVVVLCPVSLRQVWESEFATHCEVPHQVKLMVTNTSVGWSKTASLRVLIAGVESLSQGKTYELLINMLPYLGRFAFIVDESTKVKNYKATRTERAIVLARHATKRLILTGTPVTQGLQDLYSQFQVLNPQTLALKSFHAFRNRYCITEQVRGAPPGVVAIIGYQNVGELMDLIEPWSLRKEKKDCLDLPEKTYQIRRVELTPEQKKIYKSMKDAMVARVEDKLKGTSHILEAEMVLEVYLRLQQIAGGFYPEMDKDGKVIAVHPIPGPNPKLNELKDLIDEIPGKVVIMCRFRAEVTAIHEALAKIGRNVVEFHGGLKEEEKKASVNEFRYGDADVFIGTLQAASHGLTLVEASNMIYYSRGFSLEESLQSEDRIHRIGQNDPCTYVSIAAASTVDQDIVEALSQKKGVADMVNQRIKNGASLNALL